MKKGAFLLITALFLTVYSQCNAFAHKKGENVMRDMGSATSYSDGVCDFVVPESGREYIIKCNFGSAKDLSLIAKSIINEVPRGEDQNFLLSLIADAASKGANQDQSRAVLKLYDKYGELINSQVIGKTTFGKKISFYGDGGYTAKIVITEGNKGYWLLTLEYGDE